MAVFFFFTVPLILFLMSIAFDGSNINIQRSRLSDSLNESALAVAIKSSSKSNQADDITLSKNYIDYHLQGYSALREDIMVTVEHKKESSSGKGYTDYKVDGRVNVPPMITGKDRNNYGIGFSRDVKVVADANSGIVRRADMMDFTPTDYVFVFDFSPSMRYPLDATSKPQNNGAQEYPPGESKFTILRSAVSEFMSDIISSNTGSTIGIVPFTIGVPVSYPGQSSQMGGPVFGCTFAGKFKDSYILPGSSTKINYEHARKNMWFWRDKAGIYWQGDKYIENDQYDRYRMYRKLIDGSYASGGAENWHRLDEASRWLAHSWGFYTQTTGMNGKNDNSWKSAAPYLFSAADSHPWVTYSYGHNPATRIVDYSVTGILRPDGIAQDSYWQAHNANTLDYFIKSSENFISGIGLMVSAERHMSPVNVETLDFDGTFNDDFVFKGENITEYIVESSPNHSPSYIERKDNGYFATSGGEGVLLPFRNTCRFDFYSNRRAGQPEDGEIRHIPAGTQLTPGGIQPPHYLVNLSGDTSVVDKFKAMEPPRMHFPSTDSNLALLRSIPLLVNGYNPRKVIIMVTDGSDSVHDKPGHPDDGLGPNNLTKMLHKEPVGDAKICNRIRKGFINFNKGSNKETKEFDIYMITLSSQFEVDVGAENTKFWEEYCVGKGNAFQATNIDELKKALFKISRDSSINFINSGEGV